MIAGMVVVGLIGGLLLAYLIFGGRKESVPDVEAEPPMEEEAEMPPEPEEFPEDIPEDIPEEVPSEEEMPPEQEIPTEEPEPEIPPRDDLEPIPAEESMPEEIPPTPVSEDPRIVKLTEAYESGKISKELYEKNLARFKEQ